jgi:DNA primase
MSLSGDGMSAHKVCYCTNKARNPVAFPICKIRYPATPLTPAPIGRKIERYVFNVPVLYDQYFIDDLKDRADLVRLIEPYAPLKKKGANWMACCPFHQEKTPSFSVNPSKGFYKCFGCGKGGNAFTFLMEMEGLNFPEAVQRVAEMNGVPLPEPIDDGQYQQNKKRKEEKKQLSEQVIELNRIALAFWETELHGKSKQAKAAREYLEGRGISEEVQRQFRIGYSPDSWDALLGHLKDKGADEKLIEQSGLVSVNEEKERVFDRFRGRIMFPVLDVNGNPVAFGARAMGKDEPKYLNSPETPAYVKGQHLYGLFQSKDAIRQKKFAILVEGYLDLIALHQFGVTNVAASLGTAFTPEQSKLLSRFTKRVVINYDGDAAGIKAARRAIEELLPQDFDIKVLVLPEGQDPDDFIRANGAENYNEARGKAKSFLAEAMPAIAAIKNPIQKRESFDQAMTFFRIDDDGIKRDLWRSVRSDSVDSDSIGKQVRRLHHSRITIAEQQLLEMIVHDHELCEIVLSSLEETDHADLVTGPIFQALISRMGNGGLPTPEELHELFADDETLHDITGMLQLAEPRRQAGEVIDEVLRSAENCICTLRKLAIDNRLGSIAQELIAAENLTDRSLVSSLVAEQIELARIRHDLLSKIKEI